MGIGRSFTEEQFLVNEKRIILFCVVNNIDTLHVEFDGQGDSGSIEEVSFYKNDTEVKAEELPIKVFAPPLHGFNHNTDKWEHMPGGEEVVSFYEAVKNHVYAALEDTGVDWYNHEGGYGTWTWKAQQGIEFQVWQRVSNADLRIDEHREVGELV